MSQDQHSAGPPPAVTREANMASARTTRSSGRVSRGLVALGSAAVVAVYSIGYYKTKAAADRLDGDMQGRGRGPVPGGPGRAMGPGGAMAPGLDSPVQRDVSSSAGVPVAASAPQVSLSIPTVPSDRADGSGLAGKASSSSAARPESASATASVAAPGTSSAPLPAAAAAPTTSTSVSEAAAPASVAAAPAASPVPPATASATELPAAARGKYKDGVYTGWGTCRHGDLQARVEVKDGRIVSSEIAQCLTRYSCSWISPLPPQVIARQSENVDYVSGATDSAVAFYWAVFDALSKAK